MIYYSSFESPLGLLRLTQKDDALIELNIQKESGDGKKDESDTPLFDTVKSWLTRYFDGERPSSDEIKISFDGNEFENTVWNMLTQIPYGKTVTYGKIAEKARVILGKERMSAQAVGGAVGHNPIPIIVPCHRVIGSSGGLVGYTGGIDIKIKLLTLEGFKIKEYSDGKYGI